jgi:hypothetical protein
MKLAEFITADMDGILTDWEDFAHTVQAAHPMESKQLRIVRRACFGPSPRTLRTTCVDLYTW